MSSITTNVDRAIQDLYRGLAVALPTETVYGLAAMITRPDAIKRVFELKNRPLNHPLIVHVEPGFDLNELVEEIPEYAKSLIDQFWPGPLTLVFNCKENRVNPLITGGQSTVALRCPAHPLVQKILHKMKTPLVMPSANAFGKISPTTALHVKESFEDKDVLILDGGRCSIGIESTLIDATKMDSYQILRHGIIDEQALLQATSAPQVNHDHELRAPGTLKSHYQPKKNLYYFDLDENLDLFCEQRQDDVFVIAYNRPLSVGRKNFHPLATTPEEVAFDLYYLLRKADESNAMCIAMKLPPDTSEWRGVRERIIKAGFCYST